MAWFPPPNFQPDASMIIDTTQTETLGPAAEAPDWVSDDVVSECTSCFRPFSLLLRRHHCRGCGNIFCANCSTAKALLPASFSFQNGPERVCDKCSKIYFPYESNILAAGDGTKIEYGKLGSGKEIIVMLHGAMGNFSQALALSSLILDTPEKYCKYTVIAPTRPGYDRTPAFVSGNNFGKQADQVALLLDELKIYGNTKVIVVGFNIGGAVAIQFALRHPQRVASLILVSSITRTYWSGQGKGFSEDSEQNKRVLAGTETMQRLALWMLRYSATSYPNGVRTALRSVISQVSLWEPETIEKHIERIVDSPDLVWIFQAICLSLNGFNGVQLDLEAAQNLPDIPFEQISVPTMIIHGRNDGDVSLTHAQHAGTRIPNCKLLLLEETGQVWLSPHVAQLKAELAEFITQNPSVELVLTEEEQQEMNERTLIPIDSAYKQDQFVHTEDKERVSTSPLAFAARNKQISKAVQAHEELADGLFDL